MKQIYDWDARPATRNYTVADLQRLKGKRQLVQTTANTAEDAGAFSVEAEIIASEVMTAITRATTLITCSLGSGPGGDVIYLFQNDICGEQLHRPRHARAFGDLHGVRRAALRSYRIAVEQSEFPGRSETVYAGDQIVDELEVFISASRSC